MRALFASDLHGRLDRYLTLFEAVDRERPALLLLGGDLLPPGGDGGSHLASEGGDFLPDWLAPRLAALRDRLGPAYPRVLAILGNDDLRVHLPALSALEERGLLEHVHGRRIDACCFPVYGYACVPPTPFRLKDWERYDVSRFVDPGSVSPEEGSRSVAADEDDVRWGTIAGDLEALAGDADLSRAVFLFHAPPYGTALDRAALDGRSFDHAPLDPHVGSIAIRRFIEARQPLVTLHGHVHESARLTGAWSQRIGRTVCLSAAHDGPELALVGFDLEHPEQATRRLIG
ncbi:MAG TPA: metallophosphoesterase [Vicinamibacteria bacterium]|nr:metallophosphoesterase [Vicinamibacteria bacterium]